MSPCLKFFAMLAAVAVASCGGGTDGETVTFVGDLGAPDEARSWAEAQEDEARLWAELQEELKSRNVVALRYQCGYRDSSKLPFEQQGAWVGGNTPRVVYVTVAASDADTVRSMRFPGFASWIYEDFIKMHSEPFDCDPVQAASEPPFGGIS